MSLTTRKNVKERIDPKTGDIIRTSKETLKIWERIDAATGKVKDKVVSVEVQSSAPKARGAKAKRNEMIERITKMVQDCEVDYYFGNNIIECLKNYKPRLGVKKRKPKYFIPDRDKILMLYERKHGVDRVTQEVLAKEIGVLEDILRQIDSLDLEQHWRSVLVDRFVILTRLKKYQERKK